MRQTQQERSGLTFVELLMVMAIVGLIVFLLLPAIQAGRETARRSECANHLRQLGIALQSYADSSGSLPSGYLSRYTTTGADVGPGWGWAALLLNHFEENSLHARLQWGRPIEDLSNAESRTMPIATYLCPSDHVETNWSTFGRWGNVGPAPESHICDVASANYVAMSGNGRLRVAGTGLFFRNSDVCTNQITDGTSQTIAIGERSRLRGQATWVGSPTGAVLPLVRIGDDESGPLFFHAAAMVLGQFAGDPTADVDLFSSQHPGGGNFLFADGHVLFVPSNTDCAVLDAFSTRAGGEPMF